jgi:hypothetical protein
MGALMFNEQERQTIIIGLMYLMTDHNDSDLIDLGFSTLMTCGQRVEVERSEAAAQFEEFCLDLIEDIAGPTWNEENTTKNLKMEAAKRTRHKS